MRLDRFISNNTDLTRSEATVAIRNGRVCVDGVPLRRPEAKIDPASAVTLDGKVVRYSEFVWIMLNKPEGVVSATEDGGKTVLDLLPERYKRLGLFPCGRLDKNTVGLILLTNDGARAHNLLSPKSQTEKIYRFAVKFPLSQDDIAKLESGVDIPTTDGENYKTAPCRVRLTGEREGEITLTEGKYHQIKLMMGAVHNQITFLERISFAGITLDPALARGEWKEIEI